ncbi:MAG: hypothetical protein NW207_04855 [Cytophagales bacterium]|nr:hypothetical protein [Cytophagales bacterium]
MKKTILILILLLLSCSKKEEEIIKPRCETEKWGSLKILNVNSSNPYYIYLDGTYRATVDGRGTITLIELSTGTHTLYLVQKSGYVLAATTYSSSITIAQCSTKEYQF